MNSFPMHKRSLSYGLVFVSLIVGCSNRQAAVGSRQTAGTTDPKAAAITRTQPDEELAAEITQIAAAAKGRVGVSAIVLESGETLTSLNPQDHFPMQSVYKLPISMAVMKQVDAGKITLEQKVRVAKEDFVGS